jgi:hypothetical protein
MDDITGKATIRSVAGEIGEDEHARRKGAVEYAYGSARLEGFAPSPFAEEMNRRYIAGEITSDELTAAILAHCKP